VVPETDDDDLWTTRKTARCCESTTRPTYSDDNKDDDSTDGDSRGPALLGDQLQHMQLQHVLGVAAGTEDDDDTASCEADDMEEEEAKEKTGKAGAVDKG
jgi:hypothetical protein